MNPLIFNRSHSFFDIIRKDQNTQSPPSNTIIIKIDSSIIAFFLFSSKSPEKNAKKRIMKTNHPMATAPEKPAFHRPCSNFLSVIIISLIGYNKYHYLG